MNVALAYKIEDHTWIVYFCYMLQLSSVEMFYVFVEFNRNAFFFAILSVVENCKKLLTIVLRLPSIPKGWWKVRAQKKKKKQK